MLWRHCEAIGNDPGEITLTWSPEIYVRGTEADLGTESKSFWGEPMESWREGNLVGTPEQVCEKIAAYREAGLGGIVGWCADYPDTTTVELVAEHVIPKFR